MKMVDMANTPQKTEEQPMPVMQQPIYPYGLGICLGHDELAKLDLDADCEVGDMIHLMAMAKVTSISKRENSDGEDCRIELQITHLAVEDEDEEAEENEDEEIAEEKQKYRPNPSKFYKD